MRENMRGIADVVSAIFEANSHTPVSLQYLYAEIMSGKLIKIPSNAMQVTYSQMKFKHSVRGIVKSLEYKRKVKRVGRGRYQWVHDR